MDEKENSKLPDLSEAKTNIFGSESSMWGSSNIFGNQDNESKKDDFDKIFKKASNTHLFGSKPSPNLFDKESKSLFGDENMKDKPLFKFESKQNT